MPVRQLMRGVEESTLDAAPVNGAKMEVFALPRLPGGVLLTWRQKFGVAPAACQIDLESAMENVDAQFEQLDSSTVVGGEIRTIGPLSAAFVRIKQVEVGAGDDLTVGIRVD